MKWVFIGTGLFATKVLEKLYIQGLRPPLIVVPPDRRSGRGLKKKPVPVKIFAIEANIDYIESEDVNEEECREKLRLYSPDYIVVCDYGKILKKEVLDIPHIAPLNIHPSLLPRYRGAAPIERTLLNGEKKTGVTIITMTEKVDAGNIVLQKEIEIGEEDTKGDLIEKLADLVPPMLKEAMEGLKTGKLIPRPQEGNSTYATKIKKEELFINWEESALKVKNRINAFSPIPGAKTTLMGQNIKILRAKVASLDRKLTPGEIYVENHKRIFVGTGDGVIEILEIQPAGKKIMLAKDFIQGRKLEGLFFGS